MKRIHRAFWLFWGSVCLLLVVGDPVFSVYEGLDPVFQSNDIFLTELHLFVVKRTFCICFFKKNTYICAV